MPGLIVCRTYTVLLGHQEAILNIWVFPIRYTGHEGVAHTFINFFIYLYLPNMEFWKKCDLSVGV